MGTTLHISLPDWQAEFLEKLARRERTTVDIVIERLVIRESEDTKEASPEESLWQLAGIAEDRGPLIEDTPVSEKPELYLTAPKTK